MRVAGRDSGWQCGRHDILEKELHHRGGNGSVFELAATGSMGSRNDRALAHPWGHEYGRHADAEAIEREGRAGFSLLGGSGETIGCAGRRNDMVVDAAVLLVDDP